MNRESLLEQLASNPSGLSWSRRHATWIDEELSQVWRKVEGDRGGLPRMALVATGGYGRGELSPFSDVDLCLTPLDAQDPEVDSAVRDLYRAMQTRLQSDLGYSVGYRYLALADLPGLDGKSRSGLLDARLVAGDEEVFSRLMTRYWNDFPTAEFLIDKLRERNAGFEKAQESPLSVEPNLKDGAGSLRSFHTANWIRLALGERAVRPGAAYDYLLLIRNLLHIVAGRGTDVLHVARRGELAAKLKVSDLELGAQVSQAMDALESGCREAVQRIHEVRFSISPNVLALRGEVRITAGASASEAALSVAMAHELGLKIEEISSRVGEVTVGADALRALTFGESTLRALDRCQVLDALLPELTACRWMPPADAGHSWTIFEHTLRVIRELDQVDPGSWLGEAKSSLSDLGPLYFAALLHDVGKPVDGPTHPQIGAEVARRTGVEWGLSQDEVELAAWLVEEHLTMAQFLRLRDVMNAETAHDFAQVVQDEERLVCLTLLTWADIRAVGPDVWTPVQGIFIEELFRRTRDILREDQPQIDAAAVRRRLRRHLAGSEDSADQLAAFVESLPAHYMLSTPTESIRRHFEMVKSASASGQPEIDLQDFRHLNVTDLVVCAPDRPKILSDILAVLYACDVSLVTIRACTTTAEKEMIVDLFTLTFGGRCVPPAQAKLIISTLNQVLKGEISADEAMRRGGKDPDRSQRIFRWTCRPGESTIIEVQAPRGRGMAYRMAKRLSAVGWSILAARVSQWAGSAAASFYVQRPDRQPITEAEVAEALGISGV